MRKAMVVVVIGFMATACSAGPGSAVTAVSKSQYTTKAATRNTGDVTWYGDYRPPYSLDPVKVADYPEETVIPNMCESVLRVRPDYSIGPGLASAYTWTDPKHLVLTVRSGVTFWDGKAMTAQDLAYSLGRNIDSKTASSYTYTFRRVSSIAVTGDRPGTSRRTARTRTG